MHLVNQGLNYRLKGVRMQGGTKQGETSPGCWQNKKDICEGGQVEGKLFFEKWLVAPCLREGRV